MVACKHTKSCVHYSASFHDIESLNSEFFTTWKISTIQSNGASIIQNRLVTASMLAYNYSRQHHTI